MARSLRMMAQTDEEHAAMQDAAEQARQEVRDRQEYTRCPDCGTRVLRPSGRNLGGYRDPDAPMLDARPILLRPDYANHTRRVYLVRDERSDAVEVGRHTDQALYLEHVCEDR